MSGHRERHTFNSTLGTFTAVANAHKIAAIVEERDKAVTKNNEKEAFLERLELGAFSQCDKMEWGKERGFELSLVHDAGESIGDYPRVLDLFKYQFKNGVVYDYDMAGTVFPTTFAFEALSGGIFGELPRDWTNDELVKAKEIERDIIGPVKAAVAESLSLEQKAEVRSAVQAIDFAIKMTHSVMANTDYDRCNDLDNVYSSVGKFVTWYRHAEKFKSTLPPHVYTLLMVPDEHPMLCFKFARSAYHFFNKDYSKTKKVVKNVLFSGATCYPKLSDLRKMLEDESIPIKKRIDDLEEAWMKIMQECEKYRASITGTKRSSYWENVQSKRSKIVYRGKKAISEEAAR
jgi:hypothetical protein